ncbi:MAG: hypothetical protein J0M17_16460 [Planctomycetes bacterium]|nr:hypothetical protein [Planctomycetota bacterium]
MAKTRNARNPKNTRLASIQSETGILLQLARIGEAIDYFAVMKGEAELQKEVHRLLAFLTHVVQLQKVFEIGRRTKKTTEEIAGLLHITRTALHQRLQHVGLTTAELGREKANVDDLLRSNDKLADIVETLQQASKEFEIELEMEWPSINRRKRQIVRFADVAEADASASESIGSSSIAEAI